MKSVILCEGKDDLWFIAYYLHKTKGWKGNPKRNGWSSYKISPLNERQNVEYFSGDTDCTAIWSVDGKSGFKNAVKTMFEKFVEGYPQDPIESIVIIRDRDNESINDILADMSTWFPDNPVLENKISANWEKEIEGHLVSLRITPVIIPFSAEGAIETLLMGAVEEQGKEGKAIVQEANAYIDRLISEGQVGGMYLSHERLILKARYSSVIAVTNPDHSTGCFQEMVMACPWEDSAYIKEHFGIVVNAVSPEWQ